MTRVRRAVGFVAALVLAGACGGGAGAKPDGGSADVGAGPPSVDGGAGGRDGAADAAREAAQDVARDFGGPTPEAAANCPLSMGTLAAADADLLIDDFAGSGTLDGRTRSAGAFNIKEQFDATTAARFEPAPAIDPACGAAAPGAAHIEGTAADSGATFAIIFSSGGGAGKPATYYDASGTRGFTFRAALGAGKTMKLFTLQLNASGSDWDYTKDVVVTGSTWQDITVLWTDLEAAPAAPAFTPATLNQIVFPFSPSDAVDLYLDDVAFVK